MISFILMWPLRQAATIPALIITTTVLGAAWGSFDLSRRFTVAIVPRRAGAPPPSAVLCSATAMTCGGAVLWIREGLFAPRVIPPPALSIDVGPLMTRAANAATIFRVRRHAGGLSRAGAFARPPYTLINPHTHFQNLQHTVSHYPWRYRFGSAVASGVCGGVAYAVAASR